VARDSQDSCGLIVVIEHAFQGYRTIHCHLSAIGVARGQEVRRGDRIGTIGTTGMRAWPAYEHVHWELQMGRWGPYEDPVPRTIGCFARKRSYPTDHLILTYPVPC
jgi:murein DD-endopeptidase MepM/ murein hydrolase activator NlpD